MAQASAVVVDFGEFRRRRQAAQLVAAKPQTSVQTGSVMMWYPIPMWYVVPYWQVM